MYVTKHSCTCRKKIKGRRKQKKKKQNKRNKVRYKKSEKRKQKKNDLAFQEKKMEVIWTSRTPDMGQALNSVRAAGQIRTSPLLL